MIPWYKRWYVVDSGERSIGLEKELVIIKMEQFFNDTGEPFGIYTKKPKNDYQFSHNQITGNFTIRDKMEFKFSSSDESTSIFSVSGEIREDGSNTTLTYSVTLPIIITLVFFVLALIAIQQMFALFILVVIAEALGILFLRSKAKEYLQDVDIEIYKSLTS